MLRPRFRTSAFVLLLLALSVSSLWAAPFTKHPNVIEQPDGSVLHVLVTGDEYFRRIHDGRDYTIVQDPATGYFVYARVEQGLLVPTDLIVGRSNPQQAGLKPGLAPDQFYIRERHRAHWEKVQNRQAGPTRNTGSMNQIVIFIRFSGESEFSTATSHYTSILNDTSPGANSLINYYREVSYNQLTITSHLFPAPGTTVVSYQDSNSRGYYRPYSASNTSGYSGDEQRGRREQDLLKNAINAVKTAIPSNLNLDTNGDGYVDALAFVIRGQADGWSDLLWSHMWVMWYHSVYINGAQVNNYTFQMQDHAEGGLGTALFAHETFHMLGAPDLYRYYDQSLTPVGPWDVMAQTSDPPIHMSCYMKWRYGGWIASIPEITVSGDYTLNPATSSTGQCYRLRTGQSASQYFVLEYRRKTGTFESTLPDSGMIISRINPAAQYGNATGPPDEVYVFRQGGTASNGGNVSAAAFSSATGRTSFHSTSSPYPFLADGRTVNDVSISNVGAAGSTIPFSIGAVTVEDQCRDCTETYTCADYYTCIGYSGQSRYFCVQDCGYENDPDCPPDTVCKSLGSGAFGCVPYTLQGYCQGQQLWGIDACQNHILYDTCPGGTYCNDLQFTCDDTCQPRSCEVLNKTCGTHADGCGTTVYCGGCTEYANSYCSSTGHCACGQETCDSLGYECGEWRDGCGGNLVCGTCPGDLVCVLGECREEGDLPDGDAPDGDLPDGDTPDGDLPDGDTPDGDLPDGDLPDGDEDPDGDIPECAGACSVTQNPFCTVDGSGFCQCDRGMWVRTDCNAFCRGQRKLFDGCIFDIFVSIDGCLCSGTIPGGGDEDEPVDGDTEDKPGSGQSGGGSGGLCHSTQGGALWMFLILLVFGWRARTRNFV